MAGKGYETAKRSFDIVVAALLLAATAPVQGVIALIIRSRMGSPVLFRQQRPGKDGTIFELVKFRTMHDDNAQLGIAGDSARLTRLGRFLRESSLDELPTLWNVLKGDMSLVGPRPLLVAYLDRYSPEQRRRHDVRPGITGLAQVRGRNAISWDEKFAMDVDYVRRRGFALDLQILARTIGMVLSRRGVSERGQATMSEFRGSGGGGSV